MTARTFQDCARCPHLSRCDAHITGGTHRHREGRDPCSLAPPVGSVRGQGVGSESLTQSGGDR
jgi:hypothetical protein